MSKAIKKVDPNKTQILELQRFLKPIQTMHMIF